MTVRSRKPLLVAGVLLLVLVPAAFLVARRPTAVQAEWFDSNWGFRTRLDLANSTGSTQTDFQVQISTDTATLVTAGKILSNCNDLRFTDNHGKLLPHWLEPSTCNTSTTKVWIKVPSIPTGGTTIYMYYGNSGASAPPYKTTDVFIREIPNLTGAWDMDESSWTNNCSTATVLDTSGNNFSAKSCPNTTGPTGNATGQFGKAGSFDGSDDYLSISNSTTLDGRKNFSVCAWVNISTNAEHVIAGKGRDGSSTYSYLLEADYGGSHIPSFWLYDGSNNPHVYGQATLTPGTWYYECGTYDGKAMKMYINGTLQNTTFSTIDPGSNPSSNMVVGTWPNSLSSGRMAGSIDNLRFYSRALNLNEIADIFGTAGSNQGYVTTNYPGKELVRKYATGITWANSYTEESGGGPIAYWKMDEGTGQTIHDSTAHNITGTLGNTSSSSSDDPTWATADQCVSGECLLLNGTTGISISNSSALNIPGATSISMWIKPTSTSGNMAIINRSSFSADDGYSLELQSGKPTVKVNNGRVAGTIQQCNETVSANQFSYLTWTRDGSNTTKIYINSKECTYASTINTAQTAITTTTLGIGTKLNKHNIVPYWDYSNLTYNSPYTASCWSGDAGTFTYYATGGYNNLPYKILDKTGAGSGGCYRDVHSSFTIADNHNYIVSAWMKANQSVNLGNGYGLALNRFSDNTYRTGPTISLTTNWQQVSWLYASAAGHAGSYLSRDIVYVDTGLPLDVYWTGFTVEDVTGTGQTTPSLGFSGYIDEVKIYNYARSQSQINSDYNAKGTTTGSTQIGVNSTSFLNNGLIGYWKMNEATWSGTTGEILDSSANNNNGSAQGTTGGLAYPTSGKFGNGGYFDGIDDYVLIPTSTNLNVPNTFTVSAWFKPTLDSTQNIIFDRATAIRLEVSSANIVNANIGNGTSWCQTSINGGTLTTGQWAHAILTYDGTSARLYVNGTLVNTKTFSCSVSNGGNIYIGRYSGATGNEFPGVIDELRFYNRALSPTEAQSLYSWAPGPYVYLPFDEGSGTAITDYSGNNYNGVWNGTGNHWTTGKFGKAGHFDGTDDWVSFASLPTPSNMPITIEFWTKPTSATPVGIFDTAPGMTYVIRNYTAGKVEWWNAAPQITLGLSANTWTHLAFVFDSNDGRQNLNWYKNGVPQATASANGPLTWAWTTFRLGNINSGSAGWYSGDLDEFKIYNYARSNSQIIEDMNGGHPAGGSPVGSQAIYYKFNEGYGTTVNNAVSTNYTATANGSPTWTTYGKQDKALVFDDTQNQYVISNTNILLSGDQTYSVWVNPSANSSLRGVLTNHNHSTNSNMGINIASGYFCVSIGYTDNTREYSTKCTTAPATTNKWTYVVLVYTLNTNTVSFYINGKLDSSWVLTKPTKFTADKILVGQWSTAYLGQYKYAGMIDEAKVYSSALTPQQIAIDYNAGASLNFGTGYASDSAAMSDGTGNPPVAYYDFEEGTVTTAYDKGTGKNNSSAQAGTAVVTGRYGKGRSTNGSSTGVSIPDADGKNDFDYNQNFTVSAWIKSPVNQLSTTITQNMVLEKWSSTTGYPYVIRIYNQTAGASNGKISAARYDGTNNPTITSTSAYNDNKWHYVSFVKSGSSLSLYVDGAPANTSVTDTTTATTLNTSPLFIGSRNGGYPWQGSIDELKIYDYARTPAQIAYDYNRGAPVAWYKFDECSGSTLNDATGNGNNGTWAGGTSIGSCTTPSTAWGNGVTGKFNASLSFNKTNNDYVNIPGPATALQITGDITISSWVKTTNSGTYEVVVDDLGAAPFTSWGQWLDTAGKIVWYDNGTWRVSAKAVNDGNWHNIVTVVQNNNLSYYIDGVKDANTFSGIAARVATTDPKAIGRRSDSNTYLFNGQIDDVRIYNYALSQTQINNIYNGGAAVRYAPVTGTP